MSFTRAETQVLVDFHEGASILDILRDNIVNFFSEKYNSPSKAQSIDLFNNNAAQHIKTIIQVKFGNHALEIFNEIKTLNACSFYGEPKSRSRLLKEFDVTRFEIYAMNFLCVVRDLFEQHLDTNVFTKAKDSVIGEGEDVSIKTLDDSYLFWGDVDVEAFF